MMTKSTGNALLVLVEVKVWSVIVVIVHVACGGHVRAGNVTTTRSYGNLSVIVVVDTASPRTVVVRVARVGNGGNVMQLKIMSRGKMGFNVVCKHGSDPMTVDVIVARGMVRPGAGSPTMIVSIGNTVPLTNEMNGDSAIVVVTKVKRLADAGTTPYSTVSIGQRPSEIVEVKGASAVVVRKIVK